MPNYGEHIDGYFVSGCIQRNVTWSEALRVCFYVVFFCFVGGYCAGCACCVVSESEEADEGDDDDFLYHVFFGFLSGLLIRSISQCFRFVLLQKLQEQFGHIDALAELQGRQEYTMFHRTSSPPKERGTTWSLVLVKTDSSRRQYLVVARSFVCYVTFVLCHLVLPSVVVGSV